MDALKSQGRRKFIIQSSLASTTLFIPGQNIANQLFNENSIVNIELKVFLFSKSLQFLNYKEMSEAVKEMGFDGIDLTVRPKGHVLPESVIDDLPIATEVMQSFDLLPLLISTSVIDANDPIHKQVLKTASELKYRYYRPAWVPYPDDQDVMKTVKKVELQFTSLAALNKELNIIASYQNRSEPYFGAPIWDLYQVLESVSSPWIGSQYDIMHATVEGGMNWEVGFKLISPYINTLVMKDFYWGKINGKWDRINVPMGEGMVDFKRYFSLLKKYKINVPISIHVEHDLGGAENGGIPNISNKEVFKRIKNDIDFLRKMWREVY